MLTIILSNYVGSQIGERLQKCEARRNIQLQMVNMVGSSVAVGFNRSKKNRAMLGSLNTVFSDYLVV
jgi:hypothetical protein